MAIYLRARTADELWRKAVHEVRTEGVEQPSRAGNTLEVLHVCSTIVNPRQRLVFARAINTPFAIAEILWILGGRRDLGFLTFWLRGMSKYSDDGRTLNGAYGHRLRRHFRLDQVERAYRALKRSPHSRQVMLQIWDCTRDLPDPDPRSKDVPCNIASHLLVRDGRLEWLQFMRSNDLWLGLPYNLMQFTTLQEIFSGWLGLEPGGYALVSGSLHAYERDWDKIRSIEKGLHPVPENLSDLRVPHDRCVRILPRLLRACEELTRLKRPSEARSLLKSIRAIPAPYLEWLSLLAAEALRKRGFGDEAQSTIEGAGPYWKASWLLWEARMGSGARRHDPRR